MDEKSGQAFVQSVNQISWSLMDISNDPSVKLFCSEKLFVPVMNKFFLSEKKGNKKDNSSVD